MISTRLKYLLACLLMLIAPFPYSAYSGFPPTRQFYEIRIYHLSTEEQEKTVDDYLEKALLPALHKASVKDVGVFKPVGNDTASEKRTFLVLPFNSVLEAVRVEKKLMADKDLAENGKSYTNALYNQVPYNRIESILIEAFPGAPFMNVPSLKGPEAERVYELRSYESPTEKYNRSKVDMFNKGGEIGLFKRLHFNAVFYGEVLYGSHKPNLMYMTSFDNMQSREAHWKSFFNDPEWKKLSTLEQYQHNVSKADIQLLHRTSYSDY